jgi:predicted ATPase
MISRLYIKNFKALREVDLSISNINVFTGLNGMGKSTALQVLMLLHENGQLMTEIKLNGDLVKIGVLKDAFCEFASDDDIMEFN